MVLVRLWSHLSRFLLSLFDLISSKHHSSSSASSSLSSVFSYDSVGRLTLSDKAFSSLVRFSVSHLGHLVTFQILTYTKSRNANAELVSNLVDAIHRYGKIRADDLVLITRQQREFCELKKRQKEETLSSSSKKPKEREDEMEIDDKEAEEEFVTENWSEIGIAYLFFLETFSMSESFSLIEPANERFLEKCLPLVDALIAIKPPFCTGNEREEREPEKKTDSER